MGLPTDKGLMEDGASGVTRALNLHGDRRWQVGSWKFSFLCNSPLVTYHDLRIHLNIGSNKVQHVENVHSMLLVVSGPKRSARFGWVRRKEAARGEAGLRHQDH